MVWVLVAAQKLIKRFSEIIEYRGEDKPRQVVPTIQTNDEVFFARDVVATVTSAGTIYTTFATATRPRKKFMLKHAEWAMSAATDSSTGNGYITFVQGGITYSVAIGSVSTNVLDSTGPVLSTFGQGSISFDTPIPIDQNTAITLVTPNLADAVVRATISGYYIEE